MTEFCCLECRSKITRGPDGVEYGHRRYGRYEGMRCSRRPDSVDPGRSYFGEHLMEGGA